MYDVVIPLYNKAATIERCLTSIAAQTEPVNRVFVVNDGSKDDSVKLVDRFRATAGFDLQIIHQENLGVSAARNRGVVESTCDIVCFLDADDAWHPRFMETLQELTAEYPGANLYCLGHLLFESGKTFKPKHGCPEGFRGYVENFFTASSNGSVANSSKVAIRKKAFLETGGFPEGVGIGEDLYLWIRLASVGKVACDPAPLVTVYREYDEKRLTRQDGVPYPLDYFGRNKQQLRQVKGLKRFLIRIGIFHVAGSSLEGNLKGGFRRAKAVIRISTFWGLVSLIILMVPSPLLRLVKSRRSG
ncbi:glycosyltransferase family A protein [Marinobacter sp.]|uniref:glycosyltransferase family 2 protein n=1 Tax=Marinobacter sp. TaxID=50741 RepID=UPI002620D71C|nr:glycosyltransferase family A protein [Marinobacter sp.]